MPSLTYYYSQSDPNRQEFESHLRNLCDVNNLIFVDVCIEDHDELISKFGRKTPAVCIGPYVLRSPFSEVDLDVALNSAIMRHERLINEGDQNYKKRIKNGFSFSNFDQFSYFFSKYYAVIVSMILLVYIAIPFIAPFLVHKGYPRLADGIYKVYRIMCHQLAFRSFFLYGDQYFYPRELAGIDNLTTYEEIINSKTIDLNFARSFIGNEILGYKVAICQRDVAIYGSLFIFGLIFHFSGKKIKPLKWYWWLFFGLVPIGLDGLSQIPSLSSGWPAWMPIRESTPMIRLLTGSLFGSFTAWYLFPIMEESLLETRITLNRKKQLNKKLRLEKKNQDE